jgi:hypothetical protein
MRQNYQKRHAFVLGALCMWRLHDYPTYGLCKQSIEAINGLPYMWAKYGYAMLQPLDKKCISWTLMV